MDGMRTTTQEETPSQAKQTTHKILASAHLVAQAFAVLVQLERKHAARIVDVYAMSYVL